MPGTPPEAHWTYQEEVSLVGGGDIWAAAQGLIKEAREALLRQLLRRGKRERISSAPCQGLSHACWLSVSLIFSVVFLFSISLIPALKCLLWVYFAFLFLIS